jgi:hypothetical protein
MPLDTSAAPELALLAAPPQPAPPQPSAHAVTVSGSAALDDGVPGAIVPGTGAPDVGATAAGPGMGALAEPVTVGYLAGCLRLLVADPWRWWDLVRFDPRHPVRVPVTTPAPGCETWLLVLPPGFHGEAPGQASRGGVSCLVAGAVTEQTAAAPGDWRDRPLPPGRTRVHGSDGPSRLVNSGAGYAVTLHARPLAS